MIFIKTITVFGQECITEEATRHTVLCEALTKQGNNLLFNTTRIGFAKPDTFPGMKILYAMLLSPFRWANLFVKYLFIKDHDIIFLPYPAYMDGWLGCILAKLWKKKIIIDSFVCIYDTLINDRKLFSKNSIAGKIIWQYENFLLATADRILVDTDFNKEMLKKTYKLPDKKFRALPVGIDETLWKPLPTTKKKGFQIIFWCTFIPLHGAEVIADTAFLLKKYSDIQFLIIGTGQEAKQFRKRLSQLKLENLTWIDRFIPLNEIYDKMRDSHCCLGIFGDKEKTQHVIPYKAYQTLASAKPLITARTKASQRLFTHKKNVFLVPPNDPVSLANAILYLKGNRAQLTNIGINGRRLYETMLSNALVEKIMGEIIETV